EISFAEALASLGPVIGGIGKAREVGGKGRAIGGCNCFTADTKVLTDGVEKNIEDLEVGDKVLSKNEETNEVAYKEITATFNHEADEIYQIHVGDQVIESTYNHPFWVEGKGWTYVKDLRVGDLLVQSDGNTLKADSIKLERRQAKVYNLRVDGFHTYFVSDLGIWVHNTNCWGKFSADDLKKLGKADQKDIKRITGNANDAFGFFKEQVSSYKEVSPGVFVGKDANKVTFTYRASSKSGPPTIDVKGISGVRKIKFLED
ncbi:HINT domain-containing protein, partial [Paenibacillus alvei]